MSNCILLVEDNDEFRGAIQSYLELEGFTIYPATQGKEALHILEGHAVDCILADIMMPVMDGYELYRRVQENPQWAWIPFVFLTAKGTAEDIRQGKELGADDYLVKTAEPEDIIATIRGKIKRSQAQKQHIPPETIAEYRTHLAPGDLIRQRYQIIQILGEGATSHVYLAQDTTLPERTVALKRLRFTPQMNDTEQKQNRHLFEQEVRLLSQFREPCFPQLYDFFEEGEFYYLVMEYIAGETLLQKIDRATDFFPEEQVIEWGIKCCQALSILHTQNIIFRDMKPGNIMITPQNQLVLIDFGVARLFKYVQRDTIFACTVAYAAPEQLRGYSDARSDIFGLGATLYHAATRTTRTEETFPRPRTLNPNISPALEYVITKALEFDPDDRYQSATEFQHALEQVRAPHVVPEESSPPEVTAAPPPPIEPTPQHPFQTSPPLIKTPSKPHKIPTSHRILLSLLGVVVLVGFSWMIFQPSEHEDVTLQQVPVESTPAGMVRVPGGVFWMGNPEGFPAERPQIRVELNPFYLDQYEVTNAEYQRFVDSTGYDPPPHWIGGRFPPGSGHLPVTFVSQPDAQAYAAWVDKRLPTSAEWERAARGLDGRLFPWGNTFDAKKSNLQGAEDGYTALAPVGSLPTDKSPHGVFDLAGNVSEWCQDNVPNKDPLVIVRGGHWQAPADIARCTYKQTVPKTERRATLGFRCAMDVQKTYSASRD